MGQGQGVLRVIPLQIKWKLYSKSACVPAKPFDIQITLKPGRRKTSAFTQILLFSSGNIIMKQQFSLSLSTYAHTALYVSLYSTFKNSPALTGLLLIFCREKKLSLLDEVDISADYLWEMNLYKILVTLRGFKNYILNSVVVQPHIKSIFFLGNYKSIDTHGPGQSLSSVTGKLQIQ